MNRRDALKTGAVFGTAPWVTSTALAEVEIAGAPDLALESFNRVKDASDTPKIPRLQYAAGYPDKQLDGIAKYWNIKIDKIDMINKGLTDTHLEDLNQHYAEYWEQIGWQTIDLTVVKGGPDYMCRFVRGVIHMDGEQAWGRKISEYLNQEKRKPSEQRDKHTLLMLYREYDERWPNGMEWEDSPVDVRLHNYYMGQRFKHDFWEEGQEKFFR